MTKEEALLFYKEFNDLCNAYDLAIKTMSFDMSTIAPVDGNMYRIDMMTILSGELYDHQTNKENFEKLQEMSKMDLGEIMNKEVEIALKDIKKVAMLPKDFYMKMKGTYSRGEVLWKKAKYKNDYSLFKETLKDIVNVTKEAYLYYKEDKPLYDSMLDTYEAGMNMEKYDEFFHVIKERLVPFVKDVMTKGKDINDDIFHQNYPVKKQIKFSEVLQNYMNVNKDECYLGQSEHPFTVDLCLHDVRITTKYVENSLTSSIFSVIHEYGHARYSLDVDEKMEGLRVAKEMSCGMHESQSRFLENYIGKRKSFWTPLYPELQKIFPEQLKDLSLDQFIECINASHCSLIRTEADELTYPLHVLIRYEMEKLMFNGDVDFDHLDTLWADKYEQYLGVRPMDAATGILQDIHWAAGDFGYFPTYALGSGFGAQFVKAMEKDIDVDTLLENKEFDKIVSWLKDNIHKYGALYDAEKIIQKVCHEDIDVNIYIDYLIEKYTKLYF